MLPSRLALAVAALLASLVFWGCGETTFRVTGTPAEERAKTDAVNAVQGYWRAFTTGDGLAQCDLVTRRLARLRRSMGGTCQPAADPDITSLGLDIHDIRIDGRVVLVLGGGHGPYDSHRYLFRTVREGGDAKIASIDLLPPRTQGIDR